MAAAAIFIIESMAISVTLMQLVWEAAVLRLLCAACR